MTEMADSTPGVRIHERALCETTRVGVGTSIGAFSHVAADATLGRDCKVGDHVVIAGNVIVGNRVTSSGGVQLWAGIRVADDAVIGPNASFPTDTALSADHPNAATQIGPASSIGAGAVVLAGVKVGAQAVVSPGAVVTHDVPPKAIVSGHPAQIIGYVDTRRRAPAASRRDAPVGEVHVRGVRLGALKFVEDLRGNLAVGQVGVDLPFVPQRFFLVFDVPGPKVRGEHAHRVCEQFLVCTRGSIAVVVDDGRTSEEVLLDRPDLGLYVPPMVWAVQYKYSEGAVLLVMASHPYDPDDYIRDYDEFVRLVQPA